jgi:Protein of unknown function (DUF3995)
VAQTPGLVTSGILLLLSVLHVYWAAAGTGTGRAALPEQDGVPLFRPGPGVTLGVAFLLLAAATLVAARAGLIAVPVPPALIRTGNASVGVVFLARAVGDFRYVGFGKRVTGTAFARWDTRLYSPLCALVALGCLLTARS